MRGVQGVPKEVFLFDKVSNNGILFYCQKKFLVLRRIFEKDMK